MSNSHLPGKWRGFVNDGSYKILDLGRPAKFLLPSSKLKNKIHGRKIEYWLHEFLIREFGAFTTGTLPTSGFWRAGNNKIAYDKCRSYEVAFLGKQRIPILMNCLAEIAEVISEECIYFSAGQYTCLIYPPEAKKRGGRNAKYSFINRAARLAAK